MRFNNFLQTCVQFLGNTVAELSEFAVEKEFKAIQNVLWKYDVVFFDCIFGQAASWKWLYDVYIYIYMYIHTIYNIYTYYIYYTHIHTYIC